MLDLNTFGNSPCQVTLAKILQRENKNLVKKVCRFLQFWHRHLKSIACAQGPSFDEKMIVLGLLFHEAQDRFPELSGMTPKVLDYGSASLRVSYREAKRQAAIVDFQRATDRGEDTSKHPLVKRRSLQPWEGGGKTT